MNRRILKKKSKQAAEILSALGIETFTAEKGDNYHGVEIECGCPNKKPWPFNMCDCQWHPLKGTPMCGEMRGYEEPEWSEQTAWERLREMLFDGHDLGNQKGAALCLFGMNEKGLEEHLRKEAEYWKACALGMEVE